MKSNSSKDASHNKYEVPQYVKERGYFGQCDEIAEEVIQEILGQCRSHRNWTKKTEANFKVFLENYFQIIIN